MTTDFAYNRPHTSMGAAGKLQGFVSDVIATGFFLPVGVIVVVSVDSNETSVCLSDYQFETVR